MATTDPIPVITAPSARPGAGLLVVLSAMPPDQLETVLSSLTAHIPIEDLLIATPDALPAESFPGLRIIASPATNAPWTFTAADFANAWQLVQANDARAVLMLGPESSSLDSSAIHGLASAVLNSSLDLAVPCYDLPPHTGLIASAILYPLSSALFAPRLRFPLAIDLCLSLRMAERLGGAAQRFISINQGEALLWPVSEAALPGFTVGQINTGPRVIPQPVGTDLNSILPLVTASLFSDIEVKAAFWQRYRLVAPPGVPRPLSTPQPLSTDAAAELATRIQAFRLAHTNLEEIWRLVLPPNSLIGLKRLSQAEGADFRMPESLWARIVYDFLLAYRLRTINRGHLLGALIPLYLAWVASHINITAAGVNPETHIEAVAAAFEADKAYLVSRWRWPDRFNP
jgi:hypothetical protein